MKAETERQVRKCARCGVIRTDNINSDICGNCADDLRMEQEVHNHQEVEDEYKNS